MSRLLRHPFKAAVNCLDNRKWQPLLELTGGIQAGVQIYDFAGRRYSSFFYSAYSSRGSEHLQSCTFGCSLCSYFNLLKSRNLGLFCSRNLGLSCIALASGLLRGTDGQVLEKNPAHPWNSQLLPHTHLSACTQLLPLLSFTAWGLCRVRPCTSGHWHKGRNCPAQEQLWMRAPIPPCGTEPGLGCIF